MQKIIKIIILFIFLFVIGIFYVSLTRDTNYNTSSLINKETPELFLLMTQVTSQEMTLKNMIIHL